MPSSLIYPGLLAIRGRTRANKSKQMSSYSSSKDEFTLWPLRTTSSNVSVAWAALLGLGAVALFLRVLGLNQQLWFDEIVTLLDSARDPISRIVTHYAGQNQH